MADLVVVIPAYNRAHTIERAVRSVLDQDVPGLDVEVVVVDDGSTDDTVAVAEAVGDRRVRVVTQQNAGAAAARNAGVATSTAPLVTFLDSDDEAMPGWLAALHERFAAGADVVSCGAVDVDASGTVVRTRLPRGYGRAFGDAVGMFTQGGTYALRRTVFDAVGGFAADARASQHTELAYRLLPRAQREGWRLEAVHAPYIRYHLAGQGIRDDDRASYDGAVLLLTRHGDLLRSLDPVRYANHAGTAGRRALRLGRRGEALRWFARAALADPRRASRWGRLGSALLPRRR